MANFIIPYILNSIYSNDDLYVYLIFYYTLYILHNLLYNLRFFKSDYGGCTNLPLVEVNKFPCRFLMNNLIMIMNCRCYCINNENFLYFDKLYDRYNKSYKNFEGLNNLFDECNNFIENYNYEIDKHINIIKIDL